MASEKTPGVSAGEAQEPEEEAAFITDAEPIIFRSMGDVPPSFVAWVLSGQLLSQSNNQNEVLLRHIMRYFARYFGFECADTNKSTAMFPYYVAFHPTQPIFAAATKWSTHNQRTGFHMYGISQCGVRRLHACIGHEEDIKALAFHPLLPIVASGGYGKNICLYGTADGARLLKTLKQKSEKNPDAQGEDWLNSLVFHPTLPLFATTSEDGWVRIFASESTAAALAGDWSLTKTLKEPSGALNGTAVAFHPRQPVLASSNYDGKVTFYNTNSWKATRVLNFNCGRNRVQYHPTLPLVALFRNYESTAFYSDSVIDACANDTNMETVNVIKSLAYEYPSGYGTALHPTLPWFSFYDNQAAELQLRCITAPAGAGADIVKRLTDIPGSMVACSTAFHPTLPLLVCGLESKGESPKSSKFRVYNMARF